jgi:myo-inositol 2-dehydrogenase/D-chiro-inositol 1-dehydrogenase
MGKLKIGIIGAGRIGKVHALSITNNVPEAEIKWIADYKLEAIGAWADELGIPNKTGNYLDVLNDPEVDAVLICSSTDTHAQFVVDAAKAGKHIFCEKPVDLTIDKIKEALEAVQKAKVKLQIGFNRRFDHNFKTIQQVVSSGKIGEPHIIKITSRDPEPPPVAYVKVSGGMFNDMTIHDFDMARFLSGSEVDEVYVSGAVLVNEGIGKAGDLDTALINLKMKNGALCVIDNSRKACYGYDQRAEVFGSLGKVESENDKPSTVIISTAEGVVSEKPLYFFLERYMDSFRDEMKEFVSAVVNDTETPVTGNDGLQPAYIAKAAKLSYEENRPVKISEIM